MRTNRKHGFFLNFDEIAEQRVINNRANILDTAVEASRGVLTGLLPEELMARVATLQELERMKRNRIDAHKKALAERTARNRAKRAAKKAERDKGAVKAVLVDSETPGPKEQT